jgi:hypothetical protein
MRTELAHSVDLHSVCHQLSEDPDCGVALLRIWFTSLTSLD